MLRRMIRDGAPPKWTALMRLVAAEIADDARDPDDGKDASGSQVRPDEWPDYREGKTPLPWSAIPVSGDFRNDAWRDGLAEICGATPRAISDALTALARARYEMRQPITDKDGQPVTDKRGRLVFAVKGHALRFQVPPLPPRHAPDSSHQDATNDDSQSSHQDAGYPPKAAPEHEQSAQRSHPGVSKVAPECDPVSSYPLSSVPSSSGAAGLIRSVFHGATDEEIESIIADRKARGARSVFSMIRHELGAGTLRLPCDRRERGTRHSDACRSGDSARCAYGWCACRCHVRPDAGIRQAAEVFSPDTKGATA